MKHLAIDEIPTSPGPQGTMIGMGRRQQEAFSELLRAATDIGRGGRLSDHIARARAALDALERESKICVRCGVVVLGGSASPHGPCRTPATDALRDWLRGDGRHWESSDREVQIGGKKSSVEHRVRLLEERKTISVGVGPTAEAAERDALALLPKAKK